VDQALSSSVFEPIGNPAGSNKSAMAESNPLIICPVCGEKTVQEKCKIICRSETCRGRVIFNCSEF
jgi:hypothetical protein